MIRFLGEGPAQIPSGVQFLPIAVAAGVAAAASVALTVVGARRGDGLAAVSELRGPRAVRRLLWLQGALLLAVLALGAAGILAPELVPSVPDPGSVEAIVTLALGGAFYLVVALRAARTYLLPRRSADVVVVAGIAVLAVALVPAMLLDYTPLGWWLGHAFELIGIGMVALPVALDLHRGAQSRPLAGDLRGTELVSAADASSVRTSARWLPGRPRRTPTPPSTPAGWRCARSRVGEELGLPPARLRELAIGALLHDIGKLSVPNEILQKPGPLTDAEYEVIRRHPDHGHDLVLALGFSSRSRGSCATTTSDSGRAPAGPGGVRPRTASSRVVRLAP